MDDAGLILGSTECTKGTLLSGLILPERRLPPFIGWSIVERDGGLPRVAVVVVSRRKRDVVVKAVEVHSSAVKRKKQLQRVMVVEVDADVVVVCGCGGCGGISYIYMALLFWNDQRFVRLTRLTGTMLLCVYVFVWVNSIEQYNKCRWPVWWIRRRLEYLLDVGGCLLVRRILSEMVCYSLAIALYTVCNNVCYRQLRSLEKNDTIGCR